MTVTLVRAYLPFTSSAFSFVSFPCASVTQTIAVSPNTFATSSSNTVQVIGVSIRLPLKLVTTAEIFIVSPTLKVISIGLRVIYTSDAPSSVSSSLHPTKTPIHKMAIKKNIMFLYSFILKNY